MTALRAIATGDVVSVGLTYTLDGDIVTGVDADGVTLITIHNAAGHFDVIETLPPPEDYAPSEYSWDGTAWVRTEGSTKGLALNECVEDLGITKVFADEVYEALTQKGEPLELVDFFEVAAAEGAVVADFSEIWKYDGFRTTLIEALGQGNRPRVAALIATAPWTLSEATKSALQLALQRVGETVFEVWCRENGYPPLSISKQDMSRIIGLLG